MNIRYICDMYSPNLWQQYIEGNNKILGVIYTPLFQKLFLIAYKYTKNEEVSSDLVHDLFLSLLNTSNEDRKKKWDQINNHEGMLTTMIKCKALDWYKTKQNRNRIISENLTTNNTEYDDKDFVENIQLLYNIIQQLTKKEQELLNLYLAGYKNNEIAQLQNQSEKSIRNRLSESRNKLKLLWRRSYIFILILSWIN